MSGGEDLGGGFIPAPRPRGFGRLKEQPLNTGGPRREETGGRGVGEQGGGARGRPGADGSRQVQPEGGRQGGAEGGRQGGAEGGRQGGGLPPHLRKMLRDKKSKKIVSFNFDKFVEIPEVKNLHTWMKEQQLLGQEMQEGIDWIDRNQFAKKFYLHMKEEQGAVWLMEKYGEVGRDWINEEGGGVTKIMAKWEGGPTWKEVVIKGINPNTPKEVVEEVFRKYGQVKELKFVQMDGIRYNEASVLVNVEEGAEVPVFVFSSSADGDFKEMWEVVYRGRPRVCFGCYRPGHN